MTECRGAACTWLTRQLETGVYIDLVFRVVCMLQRQIAWITF